MAYTKDHMCIDKFESEKLASKIMSWCRHTEACNKISSKATVGEISCTSLDYWFIRSVRRKNNPNKKTLIYIPYILFHHSRSSYNLSFPDIILVYYNSNVIQASKSGDPITQISYQVGGKQCIYYYTI